MTKNQAHIIQKVQVEIFTSSMETGKLMERDMGSFIRERILPVIEAYLDSLDGQLANKSLRIPLLSMDIAFSKHDFPAIADLEKQILSQLDEELKVETAIFSQTSTLAGTKNIPKSRTFREKSPQPEEEVEIEKAFLLEDENKDFQAWIYFLETGRLPWWYNQKQAKEFFQFQFLRLSLRDDIKRNRLREKLSDPELFQRLVSQYTGEELRELLGFILLEKLPLSPLGFDRILASLSPTEKETFFQMLILISRQSDNKILPEIPIRWLLITKDGNRKLQTKIYRVIRKNQRKEEVIQWERFFKALNEKVEKLWDENDGSGKQEVGIDPSLNDQSGEEETHYLSHAGLILIHPFLKAFFNDCGYLDKAGNLMQPELAVHTLYYLGSRQEAPFDFELVFEKYLCGLDFHQPISRDVRLNRDILKKTDRLLESLLNHWGKLKNTGIETIRNEFVIREGKLVLGKQQDRLFVERKAQDILLDGLAWNLSIIKLPWRNKLLLVEW